MQKQTQATQAWKPLEANSDTNNHPDWRSQPVTHAQPVGAAANSSLLQPDAKPQQPEQQESLQSTGQWAVHLQQDAVLQTHESERREEQNEEQQLQQHQQQQQQQLVKQPAEKVVRQEPQQQMTKQEPERAQQQRIEQQHPQHQPENMQLPMKQFEQQPQNHPQHQPENTQEQQATQLPMNQFEQQPQEQPQQHQVVQHAAQQTADLESEPVHVSRCVLSLIWAPSVVLAVCECRFSIACFGYSRFLHALICHLPSILLQSSLWRMLPGYCS